MLFSNLKHVFDEFDVLKIRYFSNSILISPVAPSDVEVSDEAPKVTKSSDLEIECTASGVPVPEVVWFRNFVEAENQIMETGRSTLLLRNITSVDEGLYACRATNVVNQKVRSMERYSVLQGTHRSVGNWT